MTSRCYVPALPQHDAARRWLERTLTEDESVGLAWVSVLGFLRVVTNPRIFRVPLLMDRAVAVVEEWFQQQAVAVILPNAAALDDAARDVADRKGIRLPDDRRTSGGARRRARGDGLHN